MWPIQSFFLLFTVCRIFPFSLTVHNTSFPTRLVQMISICIQGHIPKLYKYFFSTFQNAKFQHHTKLFPRYSALLFN
jgi:hypothetical protein